MTHSETDQSKCLSHKFKKCSLQGLLDRLVFVDSEAKLQSLFNLDQSHVFGLHLLSILVSCLDTLLLLQTQYNIQDVLLRCQKDTMNINK